MVKRGDENPEIETAIGEGREGAEMTWKKKGKLTALKRSKTSRQDGKGLNENE